MGVICLYLSAAYPAVYGQFPQAIPQPMSAVAPAQREGKTLICSKTKTILIKSKSFVEICINLHKFIQALCPFLPHPYYVQRYSPTLKYLPLQYKLVKIFPKLTDLWSKQTFAIKITWWDVYINIHSSNLKSSNYLPKK